MSYRFVPSALLGVLLVTTSGTFAQQKDADQLLPEHKRLALLAGTWNAKLREFEPGKPPVESSGVMARTLIFGGRFLKEDFKESGGAQSQGMGILGYDTLTRRYLWVWIDSNNPDMMIASGVYNEATKTFTYESEQTEPDGRRVKARDIYRILSNDEHLFEMYRSGAEAGAKEFKILDIRFTRKR